MPRLTALLIPLLYTAAAFGEADFRQIDAPPHRYHERVPQDRFTKLKSDLESGKIPLDRTSERAFVQSLLAALDVPLSSQMLVFSNTSLQLRLISPRNPRALYFSDDLYVGWVPGGRIEIVGLDPELGAIFYIFDVPRDTQPIRVEQSDRCMNCHGADDTGHVPGLVVKSVMPGPVGGSLDSYRRGLSGHGIPLADRFGGWVVTGAGDFPHKGNAIGRYIAGALRQVPLAPGSSFDFARYPLATSDVLPQLIHEHQVGFVNRVVEAGYRARTDLFADNGKLTPAHAAELDEQARTVVRYALFADEVPLPTGGIQGEAAFKADFARQRHAAANGASLKDFDLRARLFFKNRCSYMLYTSLFQGLPPELKQRIFHRLGEALSVEKPDKEFAYLPATEKQTIHSILKSTLPDLPSGW